jgi:hypothetical protein
VAIATKIKFGDYLNVTDEGGGVIQVDGCPPGSDVAWEDVGTGAGGGGGIEILREIRGSAGASLYGTSYADLPFSTVKGTGSDDLTTDDGVGGTILYFIDSGFYAVTVTLMGSGFPAGKGFSGYLEHYAQTHWSAVSAGASNTYVTVTLVDYFPGGGTEQFRIAAVNHDTTSGRNVYIDRILIVKFDGVVV